MKNKDKITHDFRRKIDFLKDKLVSERRYLVDIKNRLHSALDRIENENNANKEVLNTIIEELRQEIKDQRTYIVALSLELNQKLELYTNFFNESQKDERISTLDS